MYKNRKDVSTKARTGIFAKTAKQFGSVRLTADNKDE